MLCAQTDKECEIPATQTSFWTSSLAAACPPRAHQASPCPAQRAGAGAAMAQGVLGSCTAGLSASASKALVNYNTTHHVLGHFPLSK